MKILRKVLVELFRFTLYLIVLSFISTSLSKYDLGFNRQESGIKKFQWSTDYYESSKSNQPNHEQGIKSETDFIYLNYTGVGDQIDSVHFTSGWDNNCKANLQPVSSLNIVGMDSVSKETQPDELSNAHKPLLPFYQDGDNLRLVMKSPNNDSFPFSRNEFTKNKK